MDIVNVSRRDLLKVSGLGGGALVLGAALPSALPVWAQTAPEKNAAQLNLFVRVQADNRVVITSHRSEMGQGIRTGLPQIVADELEADWQQISVEQAPGDQRYGDQNTDGSQSVRHFYEVMRDMGASARMMLEAAAAGVWKVPVDSCRAQMHRVIHVPSGKSLGFGELAAIAASLPAPEAGKLRRKKPDEFRYIGKGLAQVDNPDLVQGRGQFGIDVKLPGMLYASIERAPVLGSEVAAVEDAAARKISGVIDVITLPQNKLPVGFKHLPGVAVIANNTWAAERARNALKISWTKSPHDTHDSAAYLQTLVQQVQAPGSVARQTGEGRAALKAGKKTLSATYTVPYLPHATMEPPCATAQISGERCEIWAPVQSPQDVQATVAAEFGFKPENVRVNVTLLGGAFGRKSKPDFVCEAVFLARKTGKPVKVTWTRADDLQHDYLHAISAQHLQAGLDEQGRVHSWVHHSAYPSIGSTFNATTETPQPWELGLGAADIPFAIPHVSCEFSRAPSHTRIGWLRSVANIHHAFAVGSFVDELAHARGIKPLAMWRELIGADRHHDPATASYKYGNYGEKADKFPFDTARYRKVLETVAARANVDAPLPKGEGWGLAVHRSFVSYVAVAARVRVSGSGREKKLQVMEMHCVADCGRVINPDRVTAQMEGAMMFGLSIALMGEITFKAGAVEQDNFANLPLLRFQQCPRIAVQLIASDAAPGGVGEPGVPPVAPAITNALFAASGQRVRDLPLSRQFEIG